jgi:hypothetical protein
VAGRCADVRPTGIFMKMKKIMTCPQCGKAQSRWVFMRRNNFGFGPEKGPNAVGSCPICNCQFQVADYPLSFIKGLFAPSCLLILLAVLCVLCRVPVQIVNFSGLALWTVMIVGLFPYLCKLESKRPSKSSYPERPRSATKMDTISRSSCRSGRNEY